MTCSYCRAQNSAEDHRCSRCGRRLNDDAAPRTFPVNHGAVAPVYDTVEMPAPVVSPPRPGPQLVRELPTAAELAATVERPMVQPSLFGPMEVVRTRPSAAARKSTASRRRDQPTVEQAALNFDAAEQEAQPASVSVYTDAPVADPPQRITACVVDAVIPIGGFVLFLAVMQYKIGDLPLGPKALPYYGAAALILTLFYRLLFCLGNRDTFGMQWSGLRLLNFDGRRPSRRARVYRVGGGLISLLSAGLGILWALFDEERLTWHDHMSATFPTPRQLTD